MPFNALSLDSMKRHLASMKLYAREIYFFLGKGERAPPFYVYTEKQKMELYLYILDQRDVYFSASHCKLMLFKY